ncbi:DNA polymerase-3 subunit alpha [Actinopolymorpha cephalotaxi]|uniref:DNA polymerase III subunit alpha n=1 Tax=Actinopolymorpha cephalotaxi TaxID=504797 RepID=A0A1I2W8E4_9ACTN|nr:DNA polymerase III subunit alpha [Actinopolymorpha cephalotaxi]NYH82698.1 DNA polymerase-3 subunit alpha [Actinopolymorpha cephalotaxi]SFG97645.1 DNA polymerase-3 subunit alpha [Actinopolymorpha cephalotaxi]
MSDSFVHLHVHTEYSMLDGAAKLKDMFAEAQRLQMPAVAITDHGNLHGAYDFFTRATAAGITPIIGLEAYVAPTSRYHKAPVRWGQQHQKGDDVSGAGAFTHMTIWARNAVGLHNLFRLQTRASMEGFFRKPRIDRELLAEYSDGLMATTGCPSGEISTRIRLGQEKEALDAAADFGDIFGRENYFVELMDHGIDIDKRARGGLEKIAGELGLQYVVTNDSHYTYEHESTAHAALLCVQTASTLAAPTFQFEGSGYYLKPAEEMRALDSSEAWQSGCRTTLAIAERVDTTGMFEFRNLMPRFDIPEGHTDDSWLREETWRGMDRRFADGYDETYRKQVEYELGIILQMGFPAYFLVVADFIMWAKNNGIAVGPGRGSAAGSLVAYALGITDVDPLQHGLLFERFLNPERVSMPDIDIDFDERRRGEVIRYVTEKYGDDKVAQIATFGTIKAKAAIKDSSRVLGYPYALGDKITKAMPPAVMGKDIPLTGIFDKGHPRHSEAGEVRALYEQDHDVKKVIDTAKGLEGLIRQTGVHAAGVIMSAEPLADHVPLMKREADGAVITQFDYPTCETLGLLKMDFLGLRNLTIMDDAVRNIAMSRGEQIDLLKLPLDDKQTYELLARGDTLGIFQMDGGGMRSLLRLMRPDNFEDISAASALYRPGPMGANSHTNYALRKNGQQEITPIHPELEEACEEILGPTYGLIVYQEQVQRLAQKVAGYSLGQADLLRKAMGKKKKEVLDKEFGPFSEGMHSRGYSDAAVKTLWDILVPFSDYAFNKAHTAAYGLVSYWTAYLKANYPAEYMAALLTSVQDDKDKMAIYLNACRRSGIKVLPPDVNDSAANFTPVGTDIRFGLTAIRNVGANVVEAIVAAREAKGRFADASDFMAKVPATVCNKRVLESLSKAGAFDSLGHRRRALVAWHEDAVEYYIDQKRQEAIGQDSLFGFGGGDQADVAALMSPQVPEIGEWDKQTLLAHEREMLGLYVSDHPLFGIEHVLTNASDCTIGTLLADEDRPDGSIVTVGGLITSITRKMTKRGDPWAIVTLEDLEGGIDVMFFPSTYQLTALQLTEDAVVVVKGRLDRRDDVPQLIAMELSVPDISSDQQTGPFAISLARERCTPPVVDRLKEIFSTHPGMTQIHLHLRSETKTMVMRLEDRWRVTPSTALMGDLKALLGPGCVRS